jgi:hypothetical protein
MVWCLYQVPVKSIKILLGHTDIIKAHLPNNKKKICQYANMLKVYNCP